MTATPETLPAAHGLCAVLIPRALPAAQVRALRARLGLVCRHGPNIRSEYGGRCPACAVSSDRKATA